jgi:hypothetical protein
MNPAGFEPAILASELPLGSAFTDNHAFTVNIISVGFPVLTVPPNFTRFMQKNYVFWGYV